MHLLRLCVDGLSDIQERDILFQSDNCFAEDIKSGVAEERRGPHLDAFLQELYLEELVGFRNEAAQINID